MFRSIWKLLSILSVVEAKSIILKNVHENVRNGLNGMEDLLEPNHVVLPNEPVNPNEFEAIRLLVDDTRPRDGPSPYQNEVMYQNSVDQASMQRNGLLDERRRWSKGKDGFAYIPYLISSKFDANERIIIAKAFDDYHEHTCIRFVPRVNQKDYINIVKGAGCDSDAGRMGGEQIVNLGPGCVYTDTAIHELDHAVGFWHEQNRPDRENHVKVYLANVFPENRFNFDKMSKRFIDSYGVGYDTSSIMHYDKFAFSIDPPNKPVLVPIVPNEKMGFAPSLSKGDIQKINKMYGCQTKRRRDNDQEMEIEQYSLYNGIDTNGLECQNYHENCTIFANSENCEMNVWMKVNCREACGFCEIPCSDSREDCSIWASKNACTEHSEYMNIYCPVSCNQC